MSICRNNNWPSELENLINKQINVELSASHTYLMLYSYFSHDSVAFPGMCKYLKEMSDEERQHADAFIKYQNMRGGKVVIDSVSCPIFEPRQGESVLLKTFKFILELEQSVYESVLEISKKSSDPALNDFLDEILKEQLDSQYTLGVKITQLERIHNDNHGLYQFDRDLFKN